VTAGSAIARRGAGRALAGGRCGRRIVVISARRKAGKTTPRISEPIVRAAELAPRA